MLLHSLVIGLRRFNPQCTTWFTHEPKDQCVILDNVIIGLGLWYYYPCIALVCAYNAAMMTNDISCTCEIIDLSYYYVHA